MGTYGDPNIELILRARPDLLVGQEIAPQKNELLRTQVGAGCRVLLVKTDTLAEIIDSTEQMAEAAMVGERGRELVKQWQQKMAELKERYGSLAQKHRPRVYVEVASNPLQTCGAGTYLSQMIELLGGRNVGDAAGKLWPVISSEMVVVWDPQVILVMGMPRGGDYAQEITSRLGWNGMAAVRSGRIIELTDELERQGPRLFQASERLARMIHGSAELEHQP